MSDESVDISSNTEKVEDMDKSKETLDDHIPSPIKESARKRLERRLFRTPFAYARKLRARLRPEKPIVGKDGPGGHWYVRIPLWLQSTILIFFIGFLSLLLLTLVAAIQVWSYTETLMQTRLSSLAGMTAIEVEQTFHSLERSVSSEPSSTNIVNILKSANNNKSLSQFWEPLHREMNLQLSLTDCLGMIIYDKELRQVYSYRKRTSASRLLGQQSNLISRSLYPLSDPSLRDDMVDNINSKSSGVLGNSTSYQVRGSSKSVNITYSVSMGISDERGIQPYVTDDDQDPNDSKVGNRHFVGYCTYVLASPVSLGVINEQLFSQYTLEMVRLNDISVQSTYDSSLQKGEFSFLYPFIYENGSISDRESYKISQFPVLLDAIKLLADNPLGNASGNSSSNDHGGTNRTSAMPPKSDMLAIDDADGVKNSKPDVHNYARPVKLSASAFDRSNVSGNAHSSRNSTTQNNTTSSTNSGLGNSTSLINSTVYDRTPSIKTDAAVMRTETPFSDKSSVGYSFASIYDQKWLVFIQIPESEAFIDARRVRNVVVGVGCGILGAVVLILLPLSRWQTKGFYVIYENMRLRPIFYYDQPFDNDEEERTEPESKAATYLDPSHSRRLSNSQNSSRNFNGREPRSPYSSSGGSISGPPVSTVSNRASGGREIVDSTSLSVRDESRSLSNTGSCGPESRANHPQDEVSEIDFNGVTDTNSLVISQDAGVLSRSNSQRQCRVNIPRPLPPLNRWYKDEVDDLIQAYNNMTEKLNAHYLHLEDQVRLRTRESQKARELREQANIAKSEFIAIISHELRTPLNGIMGLTAVSVDETDIENIRSALGIIINSGHVLMDLLNELLELSKSLVGVDSKVYSFTPAKLLEMLLSMFSSRVQQLSCTFALAAIPSRINDIGLKGDVDHIAQICLNLMSNAMKFSEKNGNVSVILHVRPLNDPLINLAQYKDNTLKANAVLEILVTDSGLGISKEQLARIFDLFVQGENPLRKNRKGAGLGMALSKQLAEGIGGYVAVFSAKDVGTSSVIRVPVEVENYTPDTVVALDGPPIEFKVPDVYSTISLRAGEVTRVKQASMLSPTPSLHRENSSAGSNDVSSSHALVSSPFAHMPRHSHHSSGAFRVNRAHTMSKLLRGHSNADRSGHMNKSFSSQLSGNNDNDSSNASLGQPDVCGVPNSVIPAVVGYHANPSASSLLMNVPDAMFEIENSATERTSFMSARSSLVEDKERPALYGSDDSSMQQQLAPHQIDRGKSQRLVNRSRPAMLMIPPTGYSNSAPNSAAVLRSSLLLDSNPSSGNSENKPQAQFSSPERTPSPLNSIDSEARVLLAEDNMLNQEIMIKMLQQLGVKHVDTAGDGDVVIKLVEQSIVNGFHYGVIFMDLSMPTMNGIDATQCIRTTLGYPYPIIALTGYSDMETRNACLAVNIQELLTKPVMKLDILRVLQKYMPNSGQNTKDSNYLRTDSDPKARPKGTTNLISNEEI